MPPRKTSTGRDASDPDDRWDVPEVIVDFRFGQGKEVLVEYLELACERLEME